MNIKQYRYVLTLAKEGSFSKAADTLNISQPSLSQYVKKIERELGIELFDRTNGEVRITDAGRVYVDTARKILDLEHQMENTFVDLASYKTGSLIIGTSPYRAASMMPIIARSFQSIYPGIHLVVREGTTLELITGMENGSYDLVLTILPIDNQLLMWEKVMEEELVLAVPSSYSALQAIEIPKRKYPAINIKSLNGNKIVMLTDYQFMQKQLENIIVDYNLAVDIAAVVKSLEAQIEMVKAGVGIALVPSGIERFCKPNEITFYSFIQPLRKREVVVVWRKNKKFSQIAESLKKLILSISW